MLSILYAAIASHMAEINGYVIPHVGEEWIRRNDGGPRLVFIPLDDTPGPVEGPGGNPRPLLTLMKATEAVINGPTTDVVEGIRDQLLIALHHAVKGSNTGSGGRAGRYQLSKGKWTRGTIIARSGLEYRLSFSVAYPVVDRRWAAPTGDPLEPQVPDASTYTGDQANTYPVISGEELQIVADVGVRTNPPAGDNPTITINPPPDP